MALDPAQFCVRAFSVLAADHGGETSIEEESEDAPRPEIMEPPTEEHRKFYFDGGQVEIAAHLVYDLDPNGKQLRVVRYTEYAAETVRTLCPSTPELRAQWADPAQRLHRSVFRR